MSDIEPVQAPPNRTAIGGRYGSPTITVALPFSRITKVDTDLRDAVADVAALVARVATAAAAGDAVELEAVQRAAEELSAAVASAGD
jgi:hypothetical protein